MLIFRRRRSSVDAFQKYGYYRIDVESGKVRESFRRVDKAR